MTKNRPFFKKIYLFLLFTMFVVSLFGEPEELKQARLLISQKKYNDATLILTAYMAKISDKEDDWAQADKLLKDIRDKQKEYNDLYKKLIKVLYTDKDVKTALEIIDRLEQLDSAPNAVALDSVEKARKSAAFVYDQIHFEEIMAQAKTLMDQGQFQKAADLYFTGFDLQERDFKLANYDPAFFTRSDAAVQRVKESTADFWNQLRTWTLTGQSLAKDNTAVTNAVRTAWSEWIIAAQKLFVLRETARKSASDLLGINSDIQAITGDKNKEELYLGFVSRLIAGRKNSGIREGIVSSIDLAMEAVMQEIATQIQTDAASRILAAEKSMEKNDFTSVLAVLNFNPFRLEQVNELIQLKATSTVPLEVLNYPVDLTKPLSIYHRITAVLVLKNQYTIAATALGTTTNRPTNKQKADYDKFRTTLASALSIVQKTIADATTARNSVLQLSTTRYDLTKSLELMQTGISLLNTKVTQTVALNKTIMEETYSDWAVSLNNRFEPLPDEKIKGDALLNGEPRKNANGTIEEGKFSKYPNQAKATYVSTLTKLTDLRADINRFLVASSQETPEIAADSTLPVSRDDITALLSRVVLLNNDLNESIVLADQFLLLAQRALNEADLRFSQATNSMNAFQFAEALSRLEEATSRYAAYFDIQEDNQFRSATDAKIAGLNNQITTLRNRQVTEDTNRYISDAKKQYELGLYDNAQDFLLRAATRWKETHTEPNTLVVQWTKIVETARTVATGRVIPVTDPLYTDMMQLLSYAKQNYDNARSAYFSGKSDEFKTYSQESINKLSKIQSVYPLNQEASLLRLKLDMLADPATAAIRFQTKFAEAYAQQDIDPGKAYTELKDLQAINPNYPQLGGIILELEYRLGLKIRPPDPAKVAASNALAFQAKQLIDTGNVAFYAQAENLLNQALAEFPASQLVQNYFTELSIAKGGNTVVLNIADLDKLNRAQNAIYSNSLFEARRLVNELLANPNNRKYGPLLELDKYLKDRNQ